LKEHPAGNDVSGALLCTIGLSAAFIADTALDKNLSTDQKILLGEFLTKIAEADHPDFEIILPSFAWVELSDERGEDSASIQLTRFDSGGEDALKCDGVHGQLLLRDELLMSLCFSPGFSQGYFVDGVGWQWKIWVGEV
jgi:hypothetical protein